MLPQGSHSSRPDMPRGSTCKARGCTSNKSDNPELSFHSFPRNKERFKLWCDLIKRPDLNHGKALSRCISMRVCSLHFEDHMYMNPTNKTRLIWCAVPKPVEVEENSMNQNTNMDASVTSSHALRDSPDHCTEENPETKSTFQDAAENSSSSAEKSSRVTHETQSLEWDFHGFPSSKSSTSSSLQGENTDAKMSVTSESRSYIMKSADAVDRDQDSCISTEKLKTARCAHATHGNEAQPHVDERASSPSGTPVLIKDDASQPLMLQNSHRRITLAETTNSSSHSKTVQVTHNVTTSSVQPEVQNVGPQQAVCSPDNPSSIIKSNKSNTAVGRWLQYHSYQNKPYKSCSGMTSSDIPCIKEDSCEKNKVDKETSYEPEKVHDENCEQDRCSAVERVEQKGGIIKSHTWRTYSGPIQRRVVKTKEGGKRTIMIVKKASLKNLQAKGLIQPIRKYMADHPYALQSLRKTNIIQYGSDGTRNFPEHTFENLISRKGNELCRKVSSIKQSITCEGQEPRTKSSSDQYSYSTSSTQTPNLHNPDQNLQAPVTTSSADVNGPNALSFTFTVQLPAGVNRSSGTNHLPQQQTASSDSDAHCAVSHSKTQTKGLIDPNQPARSQLSNNSRISSDFKIKGNEAQVSAHSVMQNFSQRNTSTSTSNNEMQPSAVSTKFPSAGHEISGDHLQISLKENRSAGDHSLFSSVSSAENLSTGTFTSKPLNIHLNRVHDPGLPSKNGTGVKKSDSILDVEGDTMGDKLTKTRPQNRDNVQWIAVPSSSVRQPQPSSSGTTNQEEQTDSPKKNRMATIALTSAEQPGVVYKAIPLASLLQKGQKLHITPSYKSANKELKLKYARLLKKHRYRYHMLLKKYRVLEQQLSDVPVPGTPQQVIRDAQKFLSEEHVLFLESQMFLRNRPGTGNRFSRKFMKLMIKYYKRSAAGYRFLRTIFTIPSVPTVQKWLNKPIEFGDLNEDAPEGNGNNETNPPPKSKVSSSFQDTNSNPKFSKRKAMVQNLEYEENSSDGDDSEETSLEVIGS